MKTNPRIFGIYTFVASAMIFLAATQASAQLMGTAANYGVLGGSTVTNTGNSVILGALGVSPGSAITGFSAIDGGPGLFTGAVNVGNAASAQAHTDLNTAYLTLAGLSYTADLTGQDLGGLTLTPGVYFFSSSAQLTGALTLDAQGDANARFVFQIGSTLTTASNSQVNLLNLSLSDQCGPDSGLYWQVGSSATLGTTTQFSGNILALTSITLNNGAALENGRALALNGAVTMDNNQINIGDLDGGLCVTPGSGLTPVPEAGTFGIFGASFLLFAAWRRRKVASVLPTV